jgi:hypothetical protein
MNKLQMIQEILKGDIVSSIFWDDQSFIEGHEQIEIETLNGIVTIWASKDGKHLNVSATLNISESQEFVHD